MTWPLTCRVELERVKSEGLKPLTCFVMDESEGLLKLGAMVRVRSLEWKKKDNVEENVWYVCVKVCFVVWFDEVGKNHMCIFIKVP